MELDPNNMDAIVKRLQRAQGQLGGIIKMIQDGRECEEVVTQIAAVSKAVDRAGFALISNGLKECLINSDEETAGVDTARLEKLFLSLT